MPFRSLKVVCSTGVARVGAYACFVAILASGEARAELCAVDGFVTSYESSIAYSTSYRGRAVIVVRAQYEQQRYLSQERKLSPLGVKRQMLEHIGEYRSKARDSAVEFEFSGMESFVASCSGVRWVFFVQPREQIRKIHTAAGSFTNRSAEIVKKALEGELELGAQQPAFESIKNFELPK